MKNLIAHMKNLDMVGQKKGHKRSKEPEILAVVHPLEKQRRMLRQSLSEQSGNPSDGFLPSEIASLFSLDVFDLKDLHIQLEAEDLR